MSRFKSNNEEYRKIKQRVQEGVRSVPKDGKVLLQFALASIIEAIRRNPDKCNNILVCNMSSSTSIPAQQSPSWHNEGYGDMILDEANRVYDSLLHHFTNSIMDNAAGASCSSNSSLSSTFPRPSNQSNTYRIEEPEIYDNSKGDIVD